MPELVGKIEVEKKSLASFADPHEMYAFALAHVLTHRKKEFERSLASVKEAAKIDIPEHWFMREYLWVVYVSGFKAERITAKYDQLLQLHKIEDADHQYVPIRFDNLLLYDENLRPVYKVFANRKKAKAIQRVREEIQTRGWKEFYADYVKARDPVQLDRLPNIGPALACHLARNFGNLAVCKPDVHLNRLAEHFGYETPTKLLQVVSETPIGQTDLVLWMASQDLGTR